jgi:predicted DNA-binding ribbon-helix-helix protein
VQINANTLARRLEMDRWPAPGAPTSSLHQFYLAIGGRRTSVRLEPEMWNAFHEIATEQGKTVNTVATEIDNLRIASTLTSAIRLYIVRYYRSRLGPR